MKNSRNLNKFSTESFKQKTFDEWLEALGDDFDGCVEPVLKFSESVQHPQVRARELVVEVPKQDGGNQRQIALPIKFSTQPAEYKFAGVQTGTHSVEILKESGIDQRNH